MRVIACSSPYGRAGIGQHFAHLVEEARSQGTLDRYYTPRIKSGDEKGHHLDTTWWEEWALQYTPIRFSPGWRSHMANEWFDARLARYLSRPLDRLTGFVGTSLRSFRRADDLGVEERELVAANCHVRKLRRQHEKARRRHGIADSWLNDAQLRKTLMEYDTADTILVHSDYTRGSFLEAGVPESKLKRTYLHAHPRFHPPERRPDDSTFRMVYVGRVQATKGFPILLDAFSRLSTDDKHLTIVGSWSTRRMRRYVEPWLEDDRIELDPGDPLPALQAADAFVHPTYQDGFGYAPMEALACGVPVIVTEDTGMKEYVREGENGFVVPTGRVDPVVDRLEELRQHPLGARESLLPRAYYDERPSEPLVTYWPSDMKAPAVERRPDGREGDQEAQSGLTDLRADESVSRSVEPDPS